MKYSVGQVLFLLLKVEKSVIPVKIVEQVVRKSLEGETVSYSAVLPDGKETVISLDKLSKDIFISSDEAKNHMIDSATRAISKIIEKSEDMRDQFFPKADLVNSNINEESSSGEEIEIVLDDGVKGKIKLSSLDAVKQTSTVQEKR